MFLRYQAQAERNYRRAVEEFERLKALRPDLPPELPNEELPNEPIFDSPRTKPNHFHRVAHEPKSTRKPAPRPPATVGACH